MSAARVLAFFLPQFHPIEENDNAWGQGFTEWRNVARARPRFRGHAQPKLPGELGFYDLRVPETHVAQAELARTHGIDGFVYYHYWFAGRRLLHEPIDLVLEDPTLDTSFALCWANENWTRQWDGGDDAVIIAQEHSEDDDRAHAAWLAKAFADPRYIRVDGAALFCIYKPSLLPDPAQTCRVLREVAEAHGVGPLHLCMVESTPTERALDPSELGFDASIDFFPNWGRMGTPRRRTLPWRVLRRLGVGQGYFDCSVYDYATLARARMAERPRSHPPQYPVVAPGWDNSPRRKALAVVLDDPSPVVFEEWLTATLDTVEEQPWREPLVFINAWNEWAEGAALEPSRRYGRAYLTAVARVRRRRKTLVRAAP